MPRETTELEPLKILFGARALAGFIFRDEEKWRSVYPLKEQLGLFFLGGQLCGRPETISRRIAEREEDKAARRSAGRLKAVRDLDEQAATIDA